MKESSFYSDDFEQLIRDKTEQYKMYPSERVWKGVHNSLHTKRRWFIGGMSLLVTGILFFAGKELITPSAHTIARKPAPAAGSVTEATKPYLAAHLPRTSNSSNHSSSATHHNNATENDLASEGQDPEYKEISITLSHPVIDPSDLSGWLSRVQLPDHAPEIAVIGTRPGADAGKSAEDAASRAGVRPGSEGSVARDADISHETAEGYAADGDALSAHSVLESLTERGQRNARIAGHLSKNRTNGNSIIADGPNPDDIANSTKANVFAIAEAHDRSRINWLHDYALNSLPSPRNHGRTLLQLTLTPTVTYRSISGIDPSYAKYGALTGFNGSPNQLFNTSPAFGFEFGGSVVYRVTRNLSVKGGLRFNFTRFQMTSYTLSDSAHRWRNDNNSYLGMLVAQMNNSSTAGPGQNPARSTLDVSTSTLNNDFYQVSAPIGMELRVLGNERLTFNLGASVAPSYLLNTTSYTLDQGMTKYARKPQMYSKWNLNGSVEAFLSYRMGDVRWQIGPEFRYQFFNTYSSQSFITEHLKTYGLKIGIVKTLP